MQRVREHLIISSTNAWFNIPRGDFSEVCQHEFYLTTLGNEALAHIYLGVWFDHTEKITRPYLPNFGVEDPTKKPLRLAPQVDQATIIAGLALLSVCPPDDVYDDQWLTYLVRLYYRTVAELRLEYQLPT